MSLQETFILKVRFKSCALLKVTFYLEPFFLREKKTFFLETTSLLVVRIFKY